MGNAIGIVGIGLMGTAFAERLLAAGFTVVGYDTDPARRAALEGLGGTAVASAAEAVERCGTLLLAVLNIGQVEQIVEGEGGIVAASRADGRRRIVLCTVTCEPDRIEALAARVADGGVALLDAPVSGTSQQVRSGEGVGLIGGDEGAFRSVADVLAVIYPRCRFTGGAGTGTKTKLAVNHILGLNRLALAEGLVFAERLGLDKRVFLDVARQSAAYSQIMDVKGDKMVEADFTPVSKVSPHLKDVRTMIEEARRRGQALPLASALLDVLEACERNGDGNRDNAIMIEEIRRRTAPGPNIEAAQ